MYSPKIHESLIPILYKMAKEEGRPMTKLVNELLRSALHARGILHADGSIDQTSTKKPGRERPAPHIIDEQPEPVSGQER